MVSEIGLCVYKVLSKNKGQIREIIGVQTQKNSKMLYTCPKNKNKRKSFSKTNRLFHFLFLDKAAHKFNGFTQYYQKLSVRIIIFVLKKHCNFS